MFRSTNKRTRAMCLMGKLFLKNENHTNSCKYNKLKGRSWSGSKKNAFSWLQETMTGKSHHKCKMYVSVCVFFFPFSICLQTRTDAGILRELIEVREKAAKCHRKKSAIIL